MGIRVWVHGGTLAPLDPIIYFKSLQEVSDS